MRTIDVQFVLQDVGIAPLRRLAESVADIGEGLMAVEAAQLQRLAVDAETFFVNSA